MTEYAWPIVVGIFIVSHLWASWMAARERNKLLDRLMARNFDEYRGVSLEATSKPRPTPRQVEEESVDSGMLDLSTLTELSAASEAGFQQFVALPREEEQDGQERAG